MFFIWLNKCFSISWDALLRRFISFLSRFSSRLVFFLRWRSSNSLFRIIFLITPVVVMCLEDACELNTLSWTCHSHKVGKRVNKNGYHISIPLQCYCNCELNHHKDLLSSKLDLILLIFFSSRESPHRLCLRTKSWFNILLSPNVLSFRAKWVEANQWSSVSKCTQPIIS